MTILLHQSLVQFRRLILQSPQEDRLFVHLMSAAIRQQCRWPALDRRRVQLIVVDCRQIPLAATDQVHNRRTLQAHAVAHSIAQPAIRSRRVNQMRRGLVVLR